MHQEDSDCISLKLLHLYARPALEQESLDNYHTYAKQFAETNYSLGKSDGQQGRVPIWQAILIGGGVAAVSALISYGIARGAK